MEYSVEGNNMATKLRAIYETLKTLDTASQIRFCETFLKTTPSMRSCQTLAMLFSDALRDNEALDYRHETFLTSAGRKNTQSVRTRVHDCLSRPKSNPLTVNLNNGQYQFTYLGREFSPLRHLGLGWVDYFAKTEVRPVLGEVKCGDDENPFYAFIQLLTYLSETATAHQIARAVAHHELQMDVKFPQKFDLHILLVKHQAFKPASTKHQLIDSTRRLVEQLKDELASEYPSASAVIGNVLCLRMDSHAFDLDSAVSLDCIWAA